MTSLPASVPTHTHTGSQPGCWDVSVFRVQICSVDAQVHQGLAQLRHGHVWSFVQRPAGAELRLELLHDVTQGAGTVRLRHLQDDGLLSGDEEEEKGSA